MYVPVSVPLPLPGAFPVGWDDHSRQYCNNDSQIICCAALDYK